MNEEELNLKNEMIKNRRNNDILNNKLFNHKFNLILRRYNKIVNNLWF